MSRPWMLLSSTVLALCACERPAPPMAHVVATAASVAASKPSPGAADDGMTALMHAAFPGWKVDTAQVLRVPDRENPQRFVTIAAHPERVVTFDATHRALVTVASPSDPSGNDTFGAHAEQGAAGVYLFERRAGRWVKTRAQDAVAWAGSHGQLGDVKAIELGAGHPALLVEGSYTGQGETTIWAQVVEIGPDGARVVLADLPLHEDTFGAAGDGCEEWVAGTRTPTPEQLADEYPSRCHEVTGQWRIEPVAGASRGDIVVAYVRHRTIEDPQTRARTFETSRSTLVYRYGASGYAKQSGEALE